MYQVIEDDPGLHLVGSVVEDDVPLRVKYATGEAIPADERPRSLRVSLEAGPEVLPDLFILGGNPVASGRLVAALRGAGVDAFEYFPAPVARPQGTALGYGVLNVLGLADCVDRAASDFSTLLGGILRMRRLALDPARVGDLRLFRPVGLELQLLVHDDVAPALAGLAGVRLSPAEGWSDAHLF